MLEIIVTHLALLGSILRGFIWLFAIVKIVEILQYIRWTLTKGSTYRDNLLAGLNSGEPLSKTTLQALDEEYCVPWPATWKLHRRFADIPGNMSGLQRTLLVFNRGYGRWIHRQPTLVLAVAIALIVAPDAFFAPVDIALLLALMFSELANTL